MGSKPSAEARDADALRAQRRRATAADRSDRRQGRKAGATSNSRMQSHEYDRKYHRHHGTSSNAPTSASSAQSYNQKPRVTYSQNSRAPRPWTPPPQYAQPSSPYSADFTVSTDNSASVASSGVDSQYYYAHSGNLPSSRRSYVRKLSSSAGSIDSDMAQQHPRAHHAQQQPQHPQSQSRGANNAGYAHGSTGYNGGGGSNYRQSARAPPPPPPPPQKDRRIIEAEKILEEIAKEYAAKRAAGLVPTKPVPARTLLWEELARNARTQPGKRGQCVFGRDTNKMCGCTSYKKKRLHGQDNPGGVCECCNHGAAWHRLTGGAMARSSRYSRSVLGSVRPSRGDSLLPSEPRASSMYDDYDSDDDDDDLDDEAIANEMAVAHPYTTPWTPPAPHMPPPGVPMLDRSSLLSVGSSFGFPARLSSGANSLGALLQAIQRYRDLGYSEDEIEARIQEDFPPVPRKSSMLNSDEGTVDI